MFFSINLLPAKEGDCIHIRFFSIDRWFNIVIDSGPGSCSSQFRTLLNQIHNKNENVDLLCFSHCDNDHIKAAEQVFSEPTFDSSHIKQIWLNVPNEIKSQHEKLPTYQNITVEEAYKLYKLITARRIPCKTKIISGEQLMFGNISIVAVLPYEDSLNLFFEKFKNEMLTLKQKDKFIPIGGFRSDTSIYNGSSISLVLNTTQGDLLFTGDAFSADITKAAKEYVRSKGFLIVKLPHHGSDRNIDEKMLKTLNCNHFLISTQSSVYRPSQNTVNILARYGKEHNKVFIYGNYAWPFIRKPDNGIEIVKLPKSTNAISINEIKLFSEDDYEL